MPAASDITFMLTEGSGPGNTNSSTPNSSLGGFISTTAIDLVSTDNNLFDDVSDAEATAGDVEYRCVMVANNHASETAVGMIVWNSSSTAGGATEEIGVDTTAASLLSSASAQALTVANESTAPTGVTFSAAASEGAAISLGNIPALSCRAYWIKRSVAASTSAASNDGFTATHKWTNT